MTLQDFSAALQALLNRDRYEVIVDYVGYDRSVEVVVVCRGCSEQVGRAIDFFLLEDLRGFRDCVTFFNDSIL